VIHSDRMIISRTPLRVSFAGGGTDIVDYYHTGFVAVISCAIKKYVYRTINKRFDDDIRVSLKDLLRPLNVQLDYSQVKLFNLRIEGLSQNENAQVPEFQISISRRTIDWATTCSSDRHPY